MALVYVLVGQVNTTEYGYPTERILSAEDTRFTPIDDLIATDAAAAIRAANVFGSYRSYTENVAEASSASNSYQNRLTMTVTLPVGDYIVNWSFLGKFTALLAGAAFYQVTFGGTQIWEWDGASNGKYTPSDGNRKVSVTTAGAKVVNLDVRANGGTAYIKNANLWLYRYS